MLLELQDFLIYFFQIVLIVNTTSVLKCYFSFAALELVQKINHPNLKLLFVSPCPHHFSLFIAHFPDTLTSCPSVSLSLSFSPSPFLFLTFLISLFLSLSLSPHLLSLSYSLCYKGVRCLTYLLLGFLTLKITK